VKASRTRLALGAALVIVAVGGLAQPAFAHVETDPGSAAAGSTAPIGFNVEHGCDESGTVKVEMQLPEGVTDPKVARVDGWESSVAGRVITWTGGPQRHDVALLLTVEMTFPNSPGEVLFFPLVQTCEQGEIRWVDPPNPGGSEPEDPAPIVTLRAAQGATTTTSAATTAASSTTAASTTAAAATTAAPTTAAPTTATSEADEGSDDTAAVIAIVAVGIVAVVGLGAWLLARRT
jgi:uncharacterized protein YcnI